MNEDDGDDDATAWLLLTGDIDIERLEVVIMVSRDDDCAKVAETDEREATEVERLLFDGVAVAREVEVVDIDALGAFEVDETAEIAPNDAIELVEVLRLFVGERAGRFVVVALLAELLLLRCIYEVI